MNNCLLQVWEESRRKKDPISYGCSLHLNKDEYKKYIDSIYLDRGDNVPDSYERIIGTNVECFVSDLVFNKLLSDGTIRLMETEKNNLISLNEIFFK